MCNLVQNTHLQWNFPQERRRSKTAPNTANHSMSEFAPKSASFHAANPFNEEHSEEDDEYDPDENLSKATRANADHQSIR